MDYLLVGHSMRLEVDGEVFSLVFADSADHPGRYVMLQKTLAPDEQDIDLGIDGLHLEIDDQSRSGYRAISSIEVREARARIFLTGQGQESLGWESIVIAFAEKDMGAAFGALAGVVGDEFPIRLLMA
jgi:hypothetical protein